jgi:hypothetical protein
MWRITVRGNIKALQMRDRGVFLIERKKRKKRGKFLPKLMQLGTHREDLAIV